MHRIASSPTLRASTLVVATLALFLDARAAAQSFSAAGGTGDAGGNGGSFELKANRGVRAGGAAKVKLPSTPKVTSKATLVATDLDLDLDVDVADLDASPADLDPDTFEVTTAGNFLVPAGTTLLLGDDTVITSTRGGIFVAGAMQDNDGSLNGVNLTLRSVRRNVTITGTIDVDGEAAVNPGDGGTVRINALQVYVGGTATVSAHGGDSTASNEGGNGGDVRISSIRPVVQEKKVLIEVGGLATVDLRGGAGSRGGDGGTFDVDYRAQLGNASRLTLAGTIAVQGGAGEAGGNRGGNGGSILADVGGNMGLAGTLDARGGDGATGTDGGSGGRIRLGDRSPGAGLISLLGDRATPEKAVSLDVGGGDGNVDEGGRGGDVNVEVDQGKVAWRGDIDAGGGATTNGDGADGGDVLLITYGSKRADVTLEGNVTVAGSNGAVNGAGSSGGSVELYSLDGAIAVLGDIDASAGDAAGDGNDAGANGGHVFLIVDDLEADPDTTPDAGAIELSDGFGRSVRIEGDITTDGGASGGGDADGSDAGNIVVDSDPDDGENKTNLGGTLVAGSTLSAVGGNGSGTGSSGSGGDITLRGSNRKADGGDTGFVVEVGATTSTSAGTGGAGGGGASGTLTVD